MQTTSISEAATTTLFPIIATTLLLTALICVIDICHEAKSSPRHLATWSMLFFFAISALGNAMAALVAKDHFPTLANTWYMQAFVGVFGFQGVIQNLNISFHDKGFLQINHWIQLARSNASASVVEVKASAQIKRESDLAAKLGKLSVVALNSHVLTLLGPGISNTLAEKAAAENADEREVKAYALAQGAYSRASKITIP